MEELGRILTHGQQVETTATINQLEEAKARIEKRKARFLCPQFDGEKWVEIACTTCMDKHWVVCDKGENHSGSMPCPDCDQFDRVASMLNHSGIPDVQRLKSFQNFKRITGTEAAYKAAKILVGEPALATARVRFVLIYGSTGNGKTHLAYASGLEAIRSGTPSKFTRCFDMLREFKAAFSQDKFGEVMRYYREIPYLIIDEFDWRTEFDIATLDDLLAGRDADERIMLLTSNRNLEDIQDTMPRIYSRLSDRVCSVMALNEGKDYRKGKVQATKE